MYIAKYYFLKDIFLKKHRQICLDCSIFVNLNELLKWY